jgi:rRNA biogenesis protein RRP5
MKCGKSTEARQLFTKSLKSLPKHKRSFFLKIDIKNLSKYAQLEFKSGEPERGRTIFEGILDSCKKRTDLWSIYCDMEIKDGDIAHIRSLFGRILEMSWSVKKMKFFFKKYLDYEKKHGSPEGVENVKQAAIRYVESIA